MTPEQVKAHVKSMLHQLVSFHRIAVHKLKDGDEPWLLTGIRCHDCDAVFYDRVVRYQATDPNALAQTTVTFRALNSTCAQLFCIAHNLNYKGEIQ